MDSAKERIHIKWADQEVPFGNLEEFCAWWIAFRNCLRVNANNYGVCFMKPPPDSCKLSESSLCGTELEEKSLDDLFKINQISCNLEEIDNLIESGKSGSSRQDVNLEQLFLSNLEKIKLSNSTNVKKPSRSLAS